MVEDICAQRGLGAKRTFGELLQGTTSIAEKTVRPLMSAITVVSATAVVACNVYFQNVKGITT